jgi:hypothetical protein
MYAERERERERRPPESRASGASLRYEGHRSAASPPSLRRSNRIRSVGPRFRSCVYRHDRCHRDRQALLALLEPCMLEYSLLLRSEVRSSVQYTVDQLLLAGLCSGARGTRGSGIEINPDRIGNAIAKEKRGVTWSREARQRGIREVARLGLRWESVKGRLTTGPRTGGRGQNAKEEKKENQRRGRRTALNTWARTRPNDHCVREKKDDGTRSNQPREKKRVSISVERQGFFPDLVRTGTREAGDTGESKANL